MILTADEHAQVSTGCNGVGRCPAGAVCERDVPCRDRLPRASARYVVVEAEVCPEARHYILTPKSRPPLGLRRNDVHDDVRCPRPCFDASDGSRRMRPKRWADLDTPCAHPLCHNGQRWSRTAVDDMEPTGPCTDCNGTGRTIHELRADCPTCGGATKIERPWGEVYPCPTCLVAKGTTKRTGTVPLGSFTVRVLPVLHWSDHDEESPACVSVGHDDGRTYLCVQRYGGIPITLARIPVPGRDFVVALTEQETS